ncbi:unnamed protein product [Rhodiola kirilowii]
MYAGRHCSNGGRRFVLSIGVWLLLALLFRHSSASAAPSAAPALSFNSYVLSCPTVEFIVRDAVRAAAAQDPSVPGKLLRLLFHDCFVEGCDASVLLRGKDTERVDPANASLGGFSVIEAAKTTLELFCPGVVSCADTLALAARDAVELAGGPVFRIPTGRRDGLVSSAASVRPNLIDTGFTLDQIIKIFSSKGLSLVDIVTLSGAHTIGSAHCSAFSDRFTTQPNGKLTLVDSSLDPSFAAELARQCPARATPTTTVSNDPLTSATFDNQYFVNLLARRGLFQTDSILVQDQRTLRQVEDFANDQGLFFRSWAESFVKLSSVGVKGEREGEIRRVCSFVN